MVEKIAVQAVGCPQCGNEFHLRESAMTPGQSMKTHCPYCAAWLVVKPAKRQLEAALLPPSEIEKPRLDFGVLASAVETARAYRGHKSKTASPNVGVSGS